MANASVQQDVRETELLRYFDTLLLFAPPALWLAGESFIKVSTIELVVEIYIHCMVMCRHGDRHCMLYRRRASPSSMAGERHVPQPSTPRVIDVVLVC